MDRLRRRVDEVGVARVQGVGRQELGDQDRWRRAAPGRRPRSRPACGARNFHHISCHCEATKSAPARASVHRRRRPDRTARSETRVRQRRAAAAVRASRSGSLAPPPAAGCADRAIASAMSEISTPTTVSTARNIRNEPARYMSCALQRRDQHRAGRRQRQHDRDDLGARDDRRQEAADVGDEEVERHAQRVLEQRRAGRQALGAGGDDILLLQLVEQVGAQPRGSCRRCRPSPMTITGIQRCSQHRRDLGPAHRLVDDTPGSIRPPIEVPNQTLARYIRTSASRKFGVARPRRPRKVRP